MKPLESGEPDEIDLELLALGAVVDPAQRAAVEAAALGPLADADAEIRAFEAYWQAHRPPLAIGGRPASRRWWAPALALAAALLLAVGIGQLWPDPELGFRPMGGLPVDLQVTRGSTSLQAPYRLESGDDLHIGLTATQRGLVDVWTIQDDAQISVIARGQRVEVGEVFSLYGAARLDDYEGREWLVVQTTSSPRSNEAVERAAYDMLPDPSAHADDALWVMEVTRWR